MDGDSMDFKNKNLRFHFPYEGTKHEAFIFKSELNEAIRFDDNNLKHDVGVNHKFSFWAEPVVIPPHSSSSEVREFPIGGYEFHGHFTNPSLMFNGNFMLDGTLIGRLKYNFTNSFAMKSAAQINNEKAAQINHEKLRAMFGFDYKLAGYIAQLQVENNFAIKASCSKSVTSHLSLHGELSWKRDWKPVVVAGAIRYKTPRMTVAGQVSTRVAILSIIGELTEKVSVVTDLIYNFTSRDYTLRLGCVHSMKRGRWFAHLGTNGVAAQLEERLTERLHFILSTELDSNEREWKLGFGMAIA